MSNIRRVFSAMKHTKSLKEAIGVLIILLVIAILANPKTFGLNSYSLDELLDKTFMAKVVNVTDGDTITVLDKNKKQYKIRLYGIDAPESKQAYGQASKKFLSSLIASKEVKIVVVNQDKYQRTVAKVFFDGKDINKEMVANGYAHAYSEFSKQYVYQEQKAREAKLGLWKDNNPIKPSDFRKQQKGAK